MNIDFENTSLRFYGAGCNTESKAKQLLTLLERFSFQRVLVEGDLKAAGLSTLGDTNGYVAILGSGSVLIDFQNGEVNQHHGGYGREKGDEGGGFYFGKLVLNAYREKQLTPIQRSLVKSMLSIAELRNTNKGAISDDLCLKMALVLWDWVFEFENFHRKNFNLFLEMYVLNNVSENAVIHFVGSYAYYQEQILKTICHEKNLGFGKVIARPIDALVQYFKKQD